MNDATPSTRLHTMDAMRSVLMLLGVVLHAARPYTLDDWQVNDAPPLPVLEHLVSAIHLFRMPGFFVIAGFFALYLLWRRPTPVFLRERLRRVLVPLLATLLTVNLLQVWVVTPRAAIEAEGFLRGALLPAWQNGRWVSHLWFLSVLAVLFVATALLAPWLRRLQTPAVQQARAGDAVLGVVLALAVLASVAGAALTKLLDPHLERYVLGLVQPATVLEYLPYFAVGVLLCAMPALLERFARVDAMVLVAAAAAGIGLWLSDGREHPLWRVVSVGSEALLVWMAVRVLFAVFRKWADRPSPTFRYLSDASYSIYLFHHLTVIVVATALLPLALWPGFKFLIVLAVASLVPLAIHHFLIRRHAVPGYLFNGRLPARRQAAPAGTAPVLPD